MASRQLIRAVVCDLSQPDEQKSFTARCAIFRTDLSTWLARQGWAKPTTYRSLRKCGQHEERGEAGTFPYQLELSPRRGVTKGVKS